MIDFHCHLDLYPDALKIIDEVNSCNLFTLAVTTSPRAWVATSKIFEGYNNIKVALGLHPEVADKKFNEVDHLLSLIYKTDFIGEVGIDGSKQHLKILDKQELLFDSTIRECERAGGKIISIHSRNATAKVLSILRKYPNCGIPILHWFSGSKFELEEAIRIGCFFSVNQLMILNKKGKDLVSKIPVELILPESDGPFATLNGRPIFPWDAIKISDELSFVYGIDKNEIENIFINNMKHVLLKSTR